MLRDPAGCSQRRAMIGPRYSAEHMRREERQLRWFIRRSTDTGVVDLPPPRTVAASGVVVR